MKEKKIPTISGLTTTSALTAVENKILNFIIPVKKMVYDIKTSGIEKKVTDHNHDKYITTSEFNMLTAETFAARLAQAKFNKGRFWY